MLISGTSKGSTVGMFTSGKGLVSWDNPSMVASNTHSFHLGSFRLHFLKFAAKTQFVETFPKVFPKESYAI
jgi:hypothetical protein